MPIQNFSTDDVRRHERFDYWDDLLSARFFDMNVALATDKRSDFAARATLRLNRSTVMMELESTALDFERAEANIERAPSGTFVLYRQISGGISLTPHGKDAFSTAPGTLMLGSADRPFEASALGGQNHNFRILALPESRLNAVIGQRQAMTLRPVEPTEGIFALLSAYHDALWREIDHLSGAQETVAFDALAQLIAVARGAVPPEHELGREGVREARRQMAREHIEANLHDPALSPALTAAGLGISVRQLHLLFEAMNKTFARHVQSRRLERAHLMLLTEPHRPVIDIAYACGFDSLTTFNRGFRLAFGLSPTELRETKRSQG